MSPVADTPLKSLLAERGVSAKAVAEAAGMHVSNLRHQLAGRRPLNARTAQAISELTGRALADLPLDGLTLADARRSEGARKSWAGRR